MISNQPRSDHKCEICGIKYRYEGHLVKHKRMEHKPIKPKDPTIDPVAEAEEDCCDSWFCNCFLHCCCRDDNKNCFKWNIQYWIRTGKCSENDA